MIAHVDKKILIDAFREYRKDIVHNSDAFIKFLAKGADLYLYGGQSIEENNILSQFLEKREGTRIESFDSGFGTGKYSVDKRNPYQVFFLNESDEKEKDKLKDCLSSFLVGFTDDWKTKFELLSFEFCYQLSPSSSATDSVCWDDVLLDLPTTNVIICDRYIFNQDQKGETSLNRMKELLAVLKKKHQIKKVSLFTSASGIPEQTSDYGLTHNNIGDTKGQLGKFTNQIITACKDILGRETVVNVIFVDNRDEDHDRALYFHYYRVDLGSSINSLRTEDDKLIPSKRTKIEVTGYADRKCFKKSVNDLKYLRKILQETKDKIPEFPKNAYSILFNFPELKG